MDGHMDGRRWSTDPRFLDHVIRTWPFEDTSLQRTKMTEIKEGSKGA